MTTIYVNFYDVTNTAASPWNINAYGRTQAQAGPAVLTTDLLDDLSVSTNIGLELTAGPTDSSASAAQATDGAGGWPKEVFQTFWYYSGVGLGLQLSGLTDGDSYSIEVAGHAASAARDTNFTVEADTTLYDNAGAGVPNPPIVFTGTVSGTTLDISGALVSAFGYISGMKITITPAVASGPTLTGPASTTEGSATVAAGTDLDTVTTFNLISGTFSIAQTIDSATATTLNYVAESGANDCVPATPVSGVPLEATISAAGVTPYQIQQEAE